MRQADGLGGSFLADLEPSLKNAIRQRAVVSHHSGGDAIVSEADDRWTGIVLSGMARVYLQTPTGRQVTLRHARRGASIGIAALVGEGTVSAQAVTRCTVMRLDPTQVQRLAQTHPALALAIANEVSAELFAMYRELVLREEGSVRQRVAQELLHFAGELGPERPHVVPMSHEDLADAVGSVREVVTRHLSRLQAEGMLSLDRGRITLVDAERLHDAANRLD